MDDFLDLKLCCLCCCEERVEAADLLVIVRRRKMEWPTFQGKLHLRPRAAQDKKRNKAAASLKEMISNFNRHVCEKKPGF